MRRNLLSACGLLLAGSVAAATHPFDVHDLVMLDRLSDPHISPDGHWLAYQLRETQYAANRGANSVWVLDLRAPHAESLPVSATGVNAASPRWAADGKSIYFLAKGGDAQQLWRQSIAANGEHVGAAQQVTALPLDVNDFKPSPDGKRLALTMDVFPDCKDVACSRHRLDEMAASKASGKLHDKLFVRHWDTWADGRRSQLFVVTLNEAGVAATEPVRVSRGIDGDVPSKPFGDDAEYAFSPDGAWLYFDVRIAGSTESWSTNFDIYKAPVDGSAAPVDLTASNLAWDAYPVPSPDGRTLYYLAQKRPGFESDRFAVMAMDLASGAAHEVDPQWDRSAGDLHIADDGKTLYLTADEAGDHPLFAMNPVTGAVRKVVGDGGIHGYALHGSQLVVLRSSLVSPAQLLRVDARTGSTVPLTSHNAVRLSDVRMGTFEKFSFAGAGGDTVQGLVVKPADFDATRKYPVAFLIHGGPQGAFGNDWSYRWNPQTYAGQGFAVVMINFHGSTGFGQKFTDSISGDWGGKPLEDLQKGWQAALGRYSFLDGNRACALGASYGGFMIYWIAGVWQQPWKCLVDHDGVFDNRMMGYSTEELWFSEWENGGTPWAVPDNYEKFNPVDHVKDWKLPMLVIHGERDYRIPVEQGLAAFTALQRRGIPSQLLEFPDENHWVLKPQNSVLWHNTVNAWIKHWTAP